MRGFKKWFAGSGPVYRVAASEAHKCPKGATVEVAAWKGKKIKVYDPNMVDSGGF